MEKLTHYTKEEQIANVLTHLIGVVFAIYAMAKLESFSETFLQKVVAEVYGGALLFIFLASIFYHSVPEGEIRDIAHKIDRSTIYVMIGATYTPILLLVVGFPASVFLMILVWCLSLFGIFFTFSPLISRGLSTAIYLLLGWLSLGFTYVVWVNCPHSVVWLLLIGGIFFTIGSFFYLYKKKFNHTIWHLCVLAGVFMHYLAVLTVLKSV